MMITNTKNDKVKFIKRLQQKARFRKEQGLFVCEGKRLVREVPEVLLEHIYYTPDFANEDSRNAGFLGYIRKKGIPTDEVSTDVMKAMSFVEHSQGILASVRILEYDMEDVLCDKALVVVLCGLQDPGNLGTILRSAEAAGATGIVASSDTVDVYSPKVVRSTMGSIFRLPYLISGNIEGVLSDFSDKGIISYASVLDECSKAYDKVDYRGSCAILIGNEGNGIAKETAETAKESIFIPMHGRVESLNAGVACGVILFEAARQRRENADLV